MKYVVAAAVAVGLIGGASMATPNPFPENAVSFIQDHTIPEESRDRMEQESEQKPWEEDAAL
ncbi:MAG: hypothetical protein CMF55_06115 [Legionellales bacterium]|nr:hypothetical protein [Legionellales bacterium]